MSTNIYKDKHGKVITQGMTIRHEDGEEQLIYACGEDDLGFNASNEAFLKNHPSASRQFYPLYQFKLSEWTIIKKTTF